MKLIEQQNIRTSQNNKLETINNINEQNRFIKPFQTFQNSIQLMIKIHIIRFFFVTCIYYFADVFLTNNESQSNQPWNSLLYFLAMMIQIIKFIGDCSLRNLLKSQKTKLIQIHKARQNLSYIRDFQPNITLKGATYQQYLSLYSIIRIFKFKHRNYSSAFSISKYMHVLCTFLIFGWMSLREQYNDFDLIRNTSLFLFLISIYITSFEIDLYMIETSKGRLGKYFLKNMENLTSLMDYQKEDIRNNFVKWRYSFMIIQIIGSVQLGISIFLDFQISFLTFMSLVVVAVNFYGYFFERFLISKCSQAINSLKKQQINPYLILNKTIFRLNSILRYFLSLQRISLFLLFLAFARDASLHLMKFSFVFGSILILTINQNRNFMKGQSMKLMKIREIKYNDTTQMSIKQKQCSICLKQIQINQIVDILPCSKQHIFHKECFYDWIVYKKQCPLCRYSLNEYI